MYKILVTLSLVNSFKKSFEEIQKIKIEADKIVKGSTMLHIDNFFLMFYTQK